MLYLKSKTKTKRQCLNTCSLVSVPLSAWWLTPNGNTVIRSSYLLIIDIDLVFGTTCIQFNETCSLPQVTKRQYV